MNVKTQTMFFRVVIILLWSVILWVLINTGHFEVKAYWPYAGLALALGGLTALPLLRQVTLAQRLLPFLFPLVLFFGIVGNAYYTKEYISHHWLYQKNRGDRLTYWFDRYAVKMNNAPFYLSMRKFMAGNSIVSSSQKTLRKYDSLHISHLKNLTVENYPAAGIDAKIFQQLQNNPSLTTQRLTMLKVWQENNRRKVQPILFLFFLHKDGRRDTYYLHMVKIKTSQKSKLPQTGYIAVPTAIHNAFVFPERS